MNGYWVFIAAYAALGLYVIVKCIIDLYRLRKDGGNDALQRKVLIRGIVGGIGLIMLGVFIYYTKIVYRAF